MEFIDAKERNGEWQDFVDHCFDHFDTVSKSEYRQDKIDTIKSSYKIYAQKSEVTSYPWKDASNVVLPMHTITVDNLEPRLVAGITGKKPVVQFEMEGLTEQDEPTKVIEDWYNQELNGVIKIQDHASTIVHKALLEGTVFPIASYDEEEIIRKDFQFDGQGGVILDETTGEPITQEVVDQIFQGGKIEYAEFNDIYIADIADDWEKADIIRIVRPTYGQLMERKDDLGYIGDNIGEWLLKDRDTSGKMSDDDMSPSQHVEGVKITGLETIECLECHMAYVSKDEDEDDEDVKNWISERYVGLIAKDSKILLRIVKLRDINFKNEHVIKRIRLYKEHGKAYGSSIYEKIKSIQHGSSDLFNMVVNVATITMIPWFIFSDKAGLDGEAIITPGKGIKSDDPSQVVFPRFSQNPRSYIVFIEMFMSLWEKLGSIGDIQIGRLSESRKDATATETMAAIQEGNIKHNYQSVVFKEDFLSLLRTIYDLYYQKMPFNKPFVYHGKPVPIPRAFMRRPFKFRLSGSTDLSNKILEMQKNQQMFQMLRGDPVANPLELISDLIESVKPDVDPQKYINPQINQLVAIMKQNPEIMQIIQKYLMMKQEGVKQQQQAQVVNQAKTTGESMANALVQKLQQVGAKP